MKTTNSPAKIGRPTKYDPSMIEATEKYIADALPTNMEIPTIEGLSGVLHCDDDQINEWTKKYPEFHASIKKLKREQKKHLMLTGLFGGKEINATMAIFLLKCNHGMVETSRTELTGKDGKDLPTPIYGGTAK